MIELVHKFLSQEKKNFHKLQKLGKSTDLAFKSINAFKKLMQYSNLNERK